jgi:nucleotide-binding universal stress UspA family protein
MPSACRSAEGPEPRGAMSHDVLLVAVDDTESSDRAFEFAANYADRLGAELHLIHVVRRQLNMSA